MIERGISAIEVKAAIKMEKDQISLSLFLYGQNNASGIQGFYKSLSWLNAL